MLVAALANHSFLIVFFQFGASANDDVERHHAMQTDTLLPRRNRWSPNRTAFAGGTGTSIRRVAALRNLLSSGVYSGNAGRREAGPAGDHNRRNVVHLFRAPTKGAVQNRACG